MNINEELKILSNYFQGGRFDELLSKSKVLLRKNFDNPFLYNLIGSSHLQLGNINDAIYNFNISLKLYPNNLIVMNNIANAYKKDFNYKKAEEFYLLALKKKPDYLNALANYANLKMSINHTDESVKIYKKILLKHTKNHLIYFNAATAMQSLGNFDQAKIYAEKALTLKPNFTIADRLISSITKYTEENKHFLKLEKGIKNKDLRNEDRIYLRFALAKAYLDNKKYDEFFNQIQLANKEKRDSIDYNFEKDLQIFENIKLLFKDFNFNNHQFKQHNKKLIFVLGMPRSGTSLVEQIISSHSSVFGAGELPFLLNDVLKTFKSMQKDSAKLKEIFKKINIIGDNYLEQISILSSDKNIILDKSPLNFLLIGFIQILFPSAKIIHVKRDAKDTCFSCYKNSFNHGLYFTYSQKELASFYNSYSDLMKFWDKKLPNCIYTVRYEELVLEPNINIKKILNFCDLDFENNCLEFYKNKSPVRTISSSQVRKKIYKDSVLSFKRFERKLGDIFNNLDK